MLEDTELPHQIVLLSDLTVMVAEVTVTDIQVIEGTRPGDIEVQQEQELLPDTEAGEVGLGVCLYHAVPAIVVVAIAAALFAAVPQLKCLDLVLLQELTGGGHLLGAGAPQHHNLRWIHSHLSTLAKQESQVRGQGRGHLQEAEMGRKVWSHTMMVLQIQNVEADQSKSFRGHYQEKVTLGLEEW